MIVMNLTKMKMKMRKIRRKTKRSEDDTNDRFQCLCRRQRQPQLMLLRQVSMNFKTTYEKFPPAFSIINHFFVNLGQFFQAFRKRKEYEFQQLFQERVTHCPARRRAQQSTQRDTFRCAHRVGSGGNCLITINHSS